MAFLLGFCLVICALSDEQQFVDRFYATSYAGLEIFLPENWSFGGAMSYCNNLITPAQGVLWWTCDESNGNMRSGGFLPSSVPVAPNKTFWMDAQRPDGYPATAFPFVSLAVNPRGDSVSGSALPPRGDYQGLVAQTLTFSETSKNWTAATLIYLGFEIFAFAYGDSDVTGTEVYVAGWMNKDSETGGEFGGFVVARAKILPGRTELSIDEVDITPPVFAQGCYDVFTSSFKPTLHLIENYVIVLVPGRCQTFARWARVPSTTPFSTVKPDVLTPGTFGIDYVVSSAIDSYNGNFFYILKEYNKPDSELWYVVSNARNLTRYMIPLATGESTVSLTAGTGNDHISYAYAFSPQFSAGSGRVERIRFNQPTNSLAHAGFGNLPGDYFLKASSYLFISPYIYAVTNEPDGRLFRMSIDNFCDNYCGDYAYCESGTCHCIPNYSPKLTGDGCDPTKIQEEIINERQAVGAAATLGVFWVISLFVAAFGWRAWYKQSHQSPQAQHLVQEYNRPL